MPDPRTRKPAGRGLPPTITPPAPGSMLNYALPSRRPKPWPRRALNWVRYHLEDRLGNAIMWVVGPLVLGFGVFVYCFPITTTRIMMYFFGGH